MRMVFAAAAMLTMMACITFCMFATLKSEVGDLRLSLLAGICFLACLLFLNAGGFIRGQALKLFLEAIPAVGGRQRG